MSENKKHINEFKVFYADTDAYAVVWHGTYLRWMEAGRVEYTNKVLGVDLKKLQQEGCALPLLELNVKYRSSAKLDDNVVVETEIGQLRPSAVVFHQVIKNKDTGAVNVIADVTCVAVDPNTGKMFRRLPECLTEPAKNAMAE